jgi:hypothetical protein
MFNLLTQFLKSDLLPEPNGQIDHTDIGSGHSKGHSGQFALQLGDDQADCLGGPGGTGDDVQRGCTATAPVLTALGGTVYHQLGLGHRVNGRHQAFLDAVVVVYYLQFGLVKGNLLISLLIY